MNLARRVPWPLIAILSVQVVLSLRLIWTQTAFIDEATYLYAGHQMIAHWLHGTPVQDFPLFLSGSVAVYPPVGALADSVGGLAGARLLGLAFVMASTVLLYRTAKTLFGKNEATIAVALFATLMGTQFLSAFATYDPMALFLLALSAYLVVGKPYDGTLGTHVRVLLFSPCVLALANATKYATALWDPVVIALAALAPTLLAHQRTHWRSVLHIAVRYTFVLAVLLAGALLVAGPKYWTGIGYTTLARSSRQVGMGQSPTLVLHTAWRWMWPVLVPAGAIAAWYAIRRHNALAALATVLLGAALLAPLNQARIGTLVALQKHVVFGAWFGAILAAHALAVGCPGRWRRLLAPVLATCVAVLMLPVTTAQASTMYQWGRENLAFVDALRPYVHGGTERYLIEGSAYIPAYYMGSVYSVQWKESPSYTITTPAGQYLTKMAAFDYAIRNRSFTLIILSGTGPNEPGIQNLIKKYKDYRVIAHLPVQAVGEHTFYTVWQVVSPTSRSSQ